MSYKTDVSIAGVWEGDFVSATNEAARLSKPVLLVMGNAHCPCCNYLTDTALNSARFLSWSQERDLIQVHVLYNENPIAAFDWVQKHSGPKIYFPTVGIYWPQANKTTEVCFTGRDGEMPVKTGTLVEQLIASIESCIADYGKATKWEFVNGNTACNRLEAEFSTRRVFVPIRRLTNLGQEAANKLAVSSPDGLFAAYTNTVRWAVAQERAEAEIALPVFDKDSFPAGKQIDFTILGEADEVQATTHLTFVEGAPMSAKNPLFVGEKKELEAGDWSMDIDAVTNAVAAGRADYAIVYFTGALWCPHCQGLEDFVLDTKEFRDWAGPASNRVVFAVLDNPRRSADANPKKPNGAPPTLLRYEEGVNSYAGNRPSGAGYLSRKSISNVVAEAILQRNHALGYPGGFYATPEATRTGYPTFIVLDKSFRPAGRLVRVEEDRSKDAAFDPLVGNKTYYHDPVDHIQRFDDLLKLRDREEPEGDSYVSLTKAGHAADAGATAMTVQLNDRYKAFELTGLEAGVLTLTTERPSGKDVKIEYYLDGVLKSSASNELTVRVAKSHLGKRAVVRVNGYPNEKVKLGGTSIYSLTLKSSLEPAHVEEASSVPSLFSILQMIEELILEEEVASVTVKKTAGTLPPGVRLGYDAETESVCLTGHPSRVGDYMVSYSYTVKYASGQTETSEPTEVSIQVFDPSERNAYLGAALDRTVPMLDDDGKLVGTLAFSSTSRGLLSAKFVGEKVVSFAGRWQELDDEGTASALLERVTGETVFVKLDADGTLWATVSGGSFTEEIYGFAEDVDTAGLSGNYTVVLDNLGTDENQLGHGQLSLKTVGYCCDPGVRTVLYSGRLPDGKAFSGSSPFVGGGSDGVYDYGELPVFKKVGATRLGVMLSIRENGWETYQDDENSGARVIYAAEGTVPYWGERLLKAYGSYFDWYMPLFCWSAIYNHLAPTYALKIGDVKVATIIPDCEKNLVEKTEEAVAVTFKYVPETGEISGLANFKFGSGSVSGNWKAITVPGWHYDCGCTSEDAVVLPLAMGSFTFTDRSTGVSILRSLPVTLEPIED